MAAAAHPIAITDRLADELLSQIEIKEAGFLNWGFIDTRIRMDDLGSFREQLPDHLLAVWEDAAAAGLTTEDLIANLIDRKLLFRTEDYYRTRFSEAVRLLALLRQRFTEGDWNTAPRLVSDLKTRLARRRFPTRDVPISELTDLLSAQRLDGFRLTAVEQLLQDADGRELQLAVFQRDAIDQIFRNLKQHRDRGLAIGAGTGAGKTKAFYVPALAEIAANLSNSRWTQAIAIYPRIELLKDQFLEAFTESRKLDRLLRSRNKRPITIGAYYGETPYQAKSLVGNRNQFWDFKSSHGGFECPFLRCPNPSCTTAPNLIWRANLVEREAKDNERGRYGRHAVLECPECRYETPPGALALTRDHLSAEPPDVLFTTTEMLNRRLSRTNDYALFGIGTSRTPRLMLLDEIHTYDGITGAQVAYVLRRWRHARSLRTNESLTIVGLSATLTNAEEFLSQLTGLPPGHVTYIQPRDNELVHEGIEYNLVVKGDPVSGTSLLSTTVQTAMLLGRILDPLRSGGASDKSGRVSRGAYGRKIFGFTDKLDVINRWHHIELDAENKQRLSKLRLPGTNLSQSERQLRRATGQDWMVSQAIGHDLQAPLRVDLVSSQYRGVRSDAEFVIATSTLEVGFNDLEVGAILQHKAPRSMASFLQRKGRAGRTRHMRPWTVVVTSAYGRDRWAFQHAEQLFDPALPPIHLPIDNHYVQKIQGSFALMDWLARQLADAGFANVDSWTILAGKDQSYLQRQRQQAASILLQVLTGVRESELTEFIRDALDLREDPIALQSVLWDPPRSLLLEVIPSIVRQLETNWARVDGARVHEWEDLISPGPLPEFVTMNLFSDLNTPELLVTIPHTDRQSQVTAEEEELALALGMVEFAPGHVNKRFARPWDQKEAHWLALPAEEELSRDKLPLDQLDIITDEVAVNCDIQGTSIRVFRPRQYRLSRVPDKVRATSSARLKWKTHIEVPPHCAQPTSLQLAKQSPWREFVSEIASYTHRNQSWVTVTRAATGVDVDIRYTNGDGFKADLDFEDSHQPAALGFNTNVDALCFDMNQLAGEKVLTSPNWDGLRQHLSPLYFRYRLDNDDRLAAAGLSTFEIGWLWQLELSMLVATAVSLRCSLSDAAQEVRRNRDRLASRTLDVIFQTVQLTEEFDSDEHGRLHDRLLARVNDPAVVAVLEDCERVLWEPEQTALIAWLEQSYLSTLGHVFFTALTQLVPEVEPDDLHLDIDGSRIWITELTAGGTGQISRISDLMARQPRLIDAQLRNVLVNCDRATLATELASVTADLSQPASILKPAFAQGRAARTLSEHDASRRALIASLDQLGITGTRELIVSMNDKFLRTGSGPDTDELLVQLVGCWNSEECRLGCDIDLRVLAVASPRRPEIGELVHGVLHRIDPTSTPSENQVFNLLQSLLWLDCDNACPDCIEKWFPYATHVAPSRVLLTSLFQPDGSAVLYGDEGWWTEVRDQLEREFAVTITCSTDQLARCKQDVASLILEPVDTGLQLLYPSVEGVRRSRGAWRVDLALADIVDYSAEMVLQ